MDDLRFYINYVYVLVYVWVTDKFSSYSDLTCN